MATTSTQPHYDLAVIGSGPGGYVAALAASRRGLRVALIERERLGGVCLNVGCIPTKALIAVAQTMRRIHQAAAVGIHVDNVRLDYPAVIERNQRIMSQLRDGLTGLLRRQGIALTTGEAAFEDAHTLRIIREQETSTLSAERFVIATGASPNAGPWRAETRHLLTYRDLLSVTSLPKSLLIIGGGVIGCEFASCWSGFGVAVTIVEQQPSLLPGEDQEAVRLLVRHLQQRGVVIHTGATIQTLTASPQGVHATLAAGQSLEAEQCLIAIGQRPNSRGLGLESLGIETDRGIEVNEWLLTSQPHIAAIGDCLAGHGLAHVASAEGLLAVRNLYERVPESLNHRLVPRCVYTDPELAHIGLTESQAVDAVRVSRFSFAALGKSVCDEDTEGFVKLVIDAATEKVLGATIIGAQASSLIHLAVLAVQHGLTARQLAHSITAHPTLPESISEAAAQFYGEGLFSDRKARLKESIASSHAPSSRPQAAA
ncbi:MAG: dihydrolipoyl dehydrogenase [Candidatus Omnitrophica bacterium]|nr:dihydrolipoyl dehydrogenase [Candidatus Omnitrophota bacterium]